MLSSMINSPENERGSTKLKKVQELAQLFCERFRRVPKQNISIDESLINYEEEKKEKEKLCRVCTNLKQTSRNMLCLK